MIKTAIVIFILCHASFVFADNILNGIHLNNKGVASLEMQDAASAEKLFLEAMAEDPFNVLVHLNLGWTFEIQKQYDKAVKENESVLRVMGLPEDLKFKAHFNAGNAAAQGEKVDVAVRHYQEALEYNPDSIETKTNIELLFKSGAGKGKGNQGDKSGKEQSENDEGQGQQPKDQKDQSNQEQKEQKKEKPKFDSQNLSKEDVRKILEELKSQEKKIRAMEYGTKGKESSPEKDW